MANNFLPYSSLQELSALLRKRDVSATEVVTTFLDRIDRLQPELNAYITICREESLASAKIVDGLPSSSDITDKPLLGIPVALKDQFDTRGILTTNGSSAMSGYIPTEDSTVVSKLKKAGAIITGKLNMNEFAAAGGEDPPFGQPHNPWNVAYSPGGSSSGSGIAVSAGLCTVSVGEDSGGSGRMPASFCGVVSIRPSAGLVSRCGVHPLSPSLDAPSPLGRTVADCAVLLQTIAGFDPGDPLSSHRPVPNYLADLGESIRGIRIGIVREFMDDPKLDAEVRAATMTAIQVLKELGAQVEEVSIPFINHSMYALGIILWCEGAVLNSQWLQSKGHLLQPSTRLGFTAASLLPSNAYLTARRAQALIRAQVLESFQKFDLLLGPTAPKLPPKIEDALKTVNFPAKEDVIKRHAGGHVGFAPLSGCPAISVPCGYSQSGLPIGLQITGRPFEDGLVLRAAHSYEQNTAWHTRHPNL